MGSNEEGGCMKLLSSEIVNDEPKTEIRRVEYSNESCHDITRLNTKQFPKKSNIFVSCKECPCEISYLPNLVSII